MCDLGFFLLLDYLEFMFGEFGCEYYIGGMKNLLVFEWMVLVIDEIGCDAVGRISLFQII